MSQRPTSSTLPAHTRNGSDFDIIEWHRAHRSCQIFFLNHGQHEEGTHALAAFLNIKLPSQWQVRPVYNASGSALGPGAGASGYYPRPINPAVSPGETPREPHVAVSLRPFIRRLVVTGFAASNILHGLFGDHWQQGIGPIVEEERRNYLFIAKAASWEDVKTHYDIDDQQTVPHLSPLQDATEDEILTAETQWSNWMLMQDWLVGNRAPSASQDS